MENALTARQTMALTSSSSFSARTLQPTAYTARNQCGFQADFVRIVLQYKIQIYYEFTQVVHKPGPELTTYYFVTIRLIHISLKPSRLLFKTVETVSTYRA